MNSYCFCNPAHTPGNLYLDAEAHDQGLRSTKLKLKTHEWIVHLHSSTKTLWSYII